MLKQSLIVLTILIILIPPIPTMAQTDLAVKLNDAVFDSMKGELTISRLDTQLKVSMLDASPTTIIGGTELRYEDYTCKVYETPDGIEWDIILNAPPKVSSWSMKAEGAGLSWYYQPPLDSEKWPEGYTVNATHAYNDKGELVANRPINVVGSYAVYGSKYQTGKVFHVYRPQVYDAKGGETWGRLTYRGGVLTVSVDPAWLAKAAYPVIIDPLFGYTSKGLTEFASQRHFFSWGGTYSPGSDGILQNMTVYIKRCTATAQLRMAIYDAADNSLVAQTDKWAVTDGFDGLKTLDIAPVAVYAAKEYYLGWVSYIQTSFFYYDATSNGRLVDTSANDPLDDLIVWDLNQTATHMQFTIYAGYTKPPDLTPPTSTSLTSNETHIRYPCEFNATLNDETALSHYIFGWNASGAWVNMTAVNMGVVAEYNVSLTRRLPLNASINVSSTLYFNDTSDNWGSVATALTTTVDTGNINLLSLVMGVFIFLTLMLYWRRR